MEWRDVVGLEKYFEVSDTGSLRNKRTGTILKPFDNKGYWRYKLKYRDDENHVHVVRMLLHRILAMAFLPNPENKPVIDHINGDTKDNRLENLRWVSNQENLLNPIAREKNKRRWDRPGYRAHMKEARSYMWTPCMCIETGVVYATASDAAAATGRRLFAVQSSCRRFEEGSQVKHGMQGDRPILHFKYITLEEYYRRSGLNQN